MSYPDKDHIILELREELRIERERRVAAEEQAEVCFKESSLDYLTRLMTRKYATGELLKEIDMLRAGKNKSLVVLFIDVDNFKGINDCHGHDAGDDVLVEIASVFLRLTRPKTIVARWGGEEILIAFPNLSNVTRKAEQIRKEVSKHRFRNFEALSGAVTVSIGISSVGAGDMFDERSSQRILSELIAEADRAMYEAKRNGKNRVVVFNESPLENAHA